MSGKYWPVAPALADADRRLNLHLCLFCHLQRIIDFDARAVLRLGPAVNLPPSGNFGIVIIPLLYHSFDLRMGFEYDPNKSAENKRKHGIDFKEAQELWSDSELLEIPARTTDEPRWLLVGKIDQKHCSAVVTRSGENVRLISVRRARDEEVTIYESQDI